MAGYKQPQEQRAAARRQALAAMITGSVAQPLSGIAGLAGLIVGGPAKGAQYVDATQKALTYQPRDPSALNKLAQWVAPVTSRLESAKQGLGDRNFEATGSPGWAAAAQVAPDLLLTAMGARLGGIKGSPLSEMVERSAGPGMGSKAAQRGAIGAWHGSPHDFDRFDMSKLGTGEGAQAYGHGLYFAGNKDVAVQYQRQLAGDVFKAADGSLFNPSTMQHLNVRNAARKGDLDAAIARARELAASDSPVAHMAAADLAELERLQASGGISPHTGHIYNVELAPDEGDLLDWDAPLTPELVAAVQKASPGYMSMGLPNASSGITQSHAYQHLADVLGPAEASAFLRQQGIPGIRYLDGGSRAAGDGSRNYVIFDDQLVRIKGKE